MLGNFPRFMSLEADDTQDGAQVRSLLHSLLNLTSDCESYWGCGLFLFFFFLYYFFLL